MVLYFRQLFGLDATYSDCVNIAEAYGTWENNGLGVGYCLLRSDDSHYVGVSVTGLSGASRARFDDQPFDRTGEIPGFLSPMLATGLAPICRWGTAERGAATGRTYLVGISEGITGFGADQSYLGPGAGATIQILMDELRGGVLAGTGFKQAHYTSSARGGLGIGPKLLDITDCGVYNLLGSQRRRTRPE
jgi:hypothetical protein